MASSQVQIFPDPTALYRAAAGQLAALAATAVTARGRYRLVLAGGSTPRPLYQRLAASPYREQLPWQQIDFFWGDERLVPPDNRASNYGQARMHLLDHLPIPPSNIFPIQGHKRPDAAVADYTRQLRLVAPAGQLWPRFDLVLLGLGADGHTASLFPGPVPDMALCAPVMAVTADYDGRPSGRVTLTPLALNAARDLFFLVTGADKAAAVAATLNPAAGDPQKWPAQRIDLPDGTIRWFLDEPAADLLRN